MPILWRQNDLYNYPDVYVCLYDFLGCDSFELEESCRESAFDTGQDTQATFNPGGTDEQEIGVGTTFLSEVRPLRREAAP